LQIHIPDTNNKLVHLTITAKITESPIYQTVDPSCFFLSGWPLFDLPGRQADSILWYFRV